MTTVRHILVCVLLSALTALALAAIVLLRAATTTVAALPGEVRALRNDLTAEVAATRRELLSRSDRQVTALRHDVIAETDLIRETADRRIGDTLARADAALSTVAGIRQDLQPVLGNSGRIAAQVNRYVGAAVGIERAARNFGEASQDIRGALPGMLSTWDRIGFNVAGTASNIDRLTKPHWYDRLIGYGLNGVVIYRNLNPATNLTIKGAQAIASRP